MAWGQTGRHTYPCKGIAFSFFLPGYGLQVLIANERHGKKNPYLAKLSRLFRCVGKRLLVKRSSWSSTYANMASVVLPKSDAERTYDDVELVANGTSYLYNSGVKSLFWKDLTVSVKAPKGKGQKMTPILSNVCGHVVAG